MAEHALCGCISKNDGQTGPWSDEHLYALYVTPELEVYFAAKMQHLVPPVLKLQLCELLKFLVLVHYFPGNIIFGKEIDELWHLWIMQTRQYAELCSRLPGGGFRHHSSKDFPEQPLASRPTASVPSITRPTLRADRRDQFEEKTRRIIGFFVAYRENFEPLTSEKIALWPPLDRMTAKFNWSPDALETFLVSKAKELPQPNVAAA